MIGPLFWRPALRGLAVAAHLTCVGASKAETAWKVANSFAEIACRIWSPCAVDPKTVRDFTPMPRLLQIVSKLLEALAQYRQVHLRVGAYPEPHRIPIRRKTSKWLNASSTRAADEA